jgi:threonine aldolase
MGHVEKQYDFASDNTAGICPEALAALNGANSANLPSYGADALTKKVCHQVREIFETDCDVYLVFNGTAANALALAQLAQPFHSIFCHQNAHIQTDECGAPELFTGGSKLMTVKGGNGKIDLPEMKALVERQCDLHSHKPRVVSLAQSTEFGTVYQLDELARVSEFARSHKMLFHMDGARFANAIAALGCTPREMTWQVGVDVLCFGGTKNGLGAGELIVFFRRELAAEFEYRAKQGGQLASKMRFLAAPWSALLTDDLWLRNARHANAAAARLADQLSNRCGFNPVFPVQANAVFLRLSDTIAAGLVERGWSFGNFFEPGIYRFMCSWATPNDRIDRFVADAAAIPSSCT